MTKNPEQNKREEDREQELSLQQEQRLAEAMADYHDLEMIEEQVDPVEFCRRYPGIESRLLAEIRTQCQETSPFLDSQEEHCMRAAKETLPAKLSGHAILRELGSGGMGRVLLGIDEGLGRPVAIKTLAPRFAENPILRERFMHEARALARLSHPNIVHIYNLGQPDEIPHFVMEYIEGSKLTEAAQALTLRQKAELMHKVVSAVEVLHQHQIIHRDLKPGNILMGPDLEPKILDFGLALQTADRKERLTMAGDMVGTPDYFSPEQAKTETDLDARSDVFSLGIILYELLTGVTPFRAGSLPEQLRMICEQDPVLPRRLNKDIPGDLQNICLKAMEKNPADRYGSAREMANDLARYLSGEPVLASPTSYTRIMAGKIEQHLRELDGWRRDHILSVYEFDAFRRIYDRLTEREDAWILEVRRLSLAQVALYLGAWILVAGAFLLVLFRYRELSGTMAVAVGAAAAVPAAWMGIRRWNAGQFRIAIAYLLAFCMLLPVTMIVGMKEWGIHSGFSQGKQDLEFFALFDMFQPQITRVRQLPDGRAVSETVSVFRGPTNAQLWWALFLAMPVYLWLRRFTGASVFSLAFAVNGALLWLVTLLRMGMIEWFAEDRGRIFFHLIPAALLYFALAFALERLKHAADSRYFYPIAVLFTAVALSGVAAFHEPYSDWLKSAIPRTRGQLEYLFIINAALYLALQTAAEHVGTAQMRSVAKVFRFLIPGHVLTSILLLGVSATRLWEESPTSFDLRFEARLFEVLLPLAAGAFVFGSIPKQMKNFFATGLLFLAVGIIRLQNNLFEDRALWPASLLLGGLFLMYLASNYTPIKLALGRLLRRRR